MRDDKLTILCGDALTKLRELPDERVHCCVTSPPYFALRDYGTAEWEGGDEGCDHSSANPSQEHEKNRQRAVDKGYEGHRGWEGRSWRGDGAMECKCGARRIDAQIGLEKTPEEYVARMVEVFREVRRVLRRDGTLWLNMGDSYNAGRDGGWAGGKNGISKPENAPNKSGVNVAGLKPKDQCLIPHRVAMALQADGWWCRDTIIWAKPNPMPESVTDRCTKAHEYVFLLTKSARYFYDAEAIKEQGTESSVERAKYGWNGQMVFDENGKERRSQPDLVEQMGARWCPPIRNKRSVWSAEDNLALAKWLAENEPKTWERFRQESRDKKDVWNVATYSYPGAHFATYPPDLIKPCILAGTSAKGCCAKCGSPWERIVERTGGTIGKGWHNHENDIARGNRITAGELQNASHDPNYKVETLGWQPTCECIEVILSGSDVCDDVASPEVIPCTVLDPFAGSGTTGAVALELGRKAILIELSPKYVKMIEQRCNVTLGLALA